MKRSTFSMGDGRVLCVYEVGDPSGKPVVFLHGGGTGATGLFATSCDEVARQAGLRILAPDRPGLGASSPKSGRRILDWPDDVRRMADALEIGSFPVVAHCGGSAYALACAWRLPERVSAIRLVSSIAPRALVGKDRRSPLATRATLWLTAKMPNWLLDRALSGVAEGMQRDPDGTYASFLSRMPASERPLLASPSSRDLYRDCVAAAFSQGTAAAIEDLRLIFGDWSVPLTEVRQRVDLWHGERDSTAPPQMARTLADALPNAEVHLVPDAGHLSTWLGNGREILSGL